MREKIKMDGKKEGKRYDYIDNLRLLMILLVVMVHLAVTYSGIGDWYIMDTHELDAVCTVVFGLFQSFTQAYFMGFLFFISGFFVAKSYDKKGAKQFLQDRLIRLGIPTLIYMLVIHPFIRYVLLGHIWGRPPFLSYYIKYLLSFDFIGCTGPLWFAFVLLIFNIGYCLIRVITKNRKVPEDKPLFSSKASIELILTIAVTTFLIRIVQPIGTSVINMQLCFFAQYIALFIVGIKWGRYQWFSKIAYQRSKRCLLLAFIPGIIVWGIGMVAGGALDGNMDIFMGGVSWQSGLYALWESFTSVTMSIGLVGVFREKYNHQSKLIKILSDCSFSVYVFHAPIIITLSLLIYNISMYPLLKFIVASVIGIPMCFLLSYYVFRRIPLLKKVL